VEYLNKRSMANSETRLIRHPYSHPCPLCWHAPSASPPHPQRAQFPTTVPWGARPATRHGTLWRFRIRRANVSKTGSLTHPAQLQQILAHARTNSSKPNCSPCANLASIVRIGGGAAMDERGKKRRMVPILIFGRRGDNADFIFPEHV
jgi:hypothetical protein